MYVSFFTLKQACKVLAMLIFLLPKAMATVIDPQILFQAHTDLFKGYLTTIKSDLTISLPLSIFVSYSHDDETHNRRVESLCENLISIGISSENIIFDQWSNRPGGHTDLYQNIEKVLGAARVILIGSASLKRKYYDIERGNIISHEINLLRNRIVAKGQEGIIPVWFEGDFEASFPVGIQHIVARSLSQDYHAEFFDLIIDLCQLNPIDNPVKFLKQGFLREREIPEEVLQDYGERLLKFQETIAQQDALARQERLEAAHRARAREEE